jgi:hypothetical protein
VIRSSDAEIDRGLVSRRGALLPDCSRDKPPNPLFDAAGYHVRGDKVYCGVANPGSPWSH